MRSLVYGLLVLRRRNDVEAARARLEEFETFEELHGYEGLIGACAAWVAVRDGELDLVTSQADAALDEWGSEGRLGYGVFQWTARFPLLGASVARGEVDAALEHARAMLDPRQQPLPGEIASAVERAVATGLVEDLESALEVARPHGYS